jgi:hypothetical protein
MNRLISAIGTKRTSHDVGVTSEMRSTADIGGIAAARGQSFATRLSCSFSVSRTHFSTSTT